VKKKSPPYAILGAVALGILCIVFFVRWKNSQDIAAADAVTKAKADLQAQIDQLKLNAANVPPPSAPQNMRNVYYATQPVDAGEKISSAFYEKKATPTDILPDAYSDQSDIVGFYAVRKIEKGDPLTPRNIGKSLPYMSQRISPGMRAISLPVFNSEANSTGGFIVDGDLVDLIWTTLSPDGTIRLQSQFLLQKIPVLYVPGPTIKTEKTDGINPAPPPGDPIAVTFEVTPEQAQALIYLENGKNGRFNMVLRSRIDKSEIKIRPFAGADYLGNLKKIQTMSDKSEDRVRDLADKIQAEAKTQGSQGNTNETTTPTPPSP
jgi:Flp pilus assembly protein CpaB